MSDNHTDETREFNDFLVMAGNYKRFEAYEFEKDTKIKKLFDRYFFRLKDEEYSLANGKEYHLNKLKNEIRDYFKERYIDNPDDAYNKVLGNEKSQKEGLMIKDLFKIKSLKLAMSISSEDYPQLFHSHIIFHKYLDRARTWETKQIEKNDYEAYQKLKELAKKNTKEKPPNKKMIKFKQKLSTMKRSKQKIKEWHLYCIAINQAEQFIKEKYKGWGSELSKAERRKINKKLEVISEQLKIFDNNIFNSMALHDIANTIKYTFNSLKTEKLLSYNLPQIDTKAKAKAITEDLLPPYN